MADRAANDNEDFGAGANLGVREAAAIGATQCVLLNPDASIDPESFRRPAAQAAIHPMTLFAPRIFRPDGTVPFEGSWFEAAISWVPWLTGACLAVSTELWEQVGGLTRGSSSTGRTLSVPGALARPAARCW